MLKLFRFLKPYTLMIILVLAFIFLQTLGDLYLPTLMGDIINKGVMQGDTGKILQIGVMMLLVTAGGVICAVISSYLSARISTGFGASLRSRIFRKVSGFSLNEFDRFGTATLITRTTNDVFQVQMVAIMIMRMMISAPMMAVGGTILALRRDRDLTLVLVFALPVLASVVILTASKTLPLFRSVQKKIDKMNLVLREKLTGVRVIRAFNASEREEKRFSQANDDLTDTYIKVNRIMAFMMPAIMTVMSLTQLAIIWFGGLRVSQGSMDLGSLSSFTQYAIQIMMSMLMLAFMFIMVPRAQAAASRINEVLETEPEIVDPEKASTAAAGRGHIEFRDVTFRYKGAEMPVLRDISFSGRAGRGDCDNREHGFRQIHTDKSHTPFL